jgi:hypothetical protein
MIAESIGQMRAVGVKRYIQSVPYLRGGCFAAHRTTVESVAATTIPAEPKNSDDRLFSGACLEVGADLIDVPLFEIGMEWTGASPVWHPHKFGVGRTYIRQRIELFESQIARYV